MTGRDIIEILRSSAETMAPLAGGVFVASIELTAAWDFKAIVTLSNDERFLIDVEKIN